MSRFSLAIVVVMMSSICFHAGVAIAQEDDEGPRPPKKPGEQGAFDLTEDEMCEVIEFCEKYMPERLERIAQMKREKPELLRRVLRRHLQEIMELKKLRETDPEKFKKALDERLYGWEDERDNPPREKGRFEKIKKELNEAETEEVLSWLREFHPARLQKLEAAKTERPGEYARFLAMCYAEMTKDREFMQRDPEGYQRMLKMRKLEQECNDLVQKYRKETNEETRKTLRGQLAQIASELFDIRQANREQEIKRIEEELARLRNNLQKRKSSKQEIVDHHLKGILGEKEDLEW